LCYPQQSQLCYPQQSQLCYPQQSPLCYPALNRCFEQFPLRNYNTTCSFGGYGDFGGCGY
jgi:hypothetical protein